MKNEVGTPVVAGIIVVVVLILAGLAYSMFGPKSKGSSVADRERAFKNDPKAAAMYKAMQEGHGSGGATPPGNIPRMGH